MPQVLTTNARIVCPHGGLGTSFPSSTKWSVSGGIVLVENDSGRLDCPFVPLPCASYRLRSMGLNASRIDGRRVILVTDFNQTLTGLPLIMAETHTIVDNSTPAPLPPGQPAPPLAPELLDIAAPIVTVAPPVLAFDAVTQTPPTLAMTFTLAAAHPLQWVLTLINEPLKSHADLTAGQPPNLTVAPAGGGWEQAALTVTVTMNAAFMTALTPGRHHFYLTGVSRRGLSGHAESVLTVTGGP